MIVWPPSALAVMQFCCDQRPEWADLNHTLSPDQYASVSSPYSTNSFFPHQTVYELDSVKFSFIAKSAKANIHLTHCQCSAFICKWRDNACTLRTFTVIFGNITKLVGSIFTYWHLCILCGFVHLRKIKSIFTLFNLK